MSWDKYYSGTIQKGSQGDDVKKWQEFLNTQGYGLSVDGDFGNKTYAATTDWQSKNGLGVDGIVGKNTWGKAGYSNINTPVSAPNTSPAPTAPSYDTSRYDDSEEGKTAKDAYGSAKDAVTNYGDFVFSGNDWLESVKNSIKNYGDFSYDMNADAFYQQYKDKYIQQGKMAMADTMGQAAALTGGYGNSYAQSVGQQAYQQSLDQLNDKIPEFYQMALDRYNMGKDDLYNQYGLLMSEYEKEYGLHSDEYNKLLDSLGIAKDDYYNGADMFYRDQDNKNTAANNTFNNEMSIWEAETSEAWNQAEWDENLRRYIINQQTTSGSTSTGSSSGKTSGSSSGGSSSGSGSNTTSSGTSATKGYSDFSVEQYNQNSKENGGSHYKDVLADLKAMKANGVGTTEVSAYLQEMVGNSFITQGDYMSLYNKYRDDRL